MADLFKLLGIGYLFAVLLLVWELISITLSNAAREYTLPFTIIALFGMLIFFIIVYYAGLVYDKKSK
ncbi:MAG: hypothetical protein QXV69_08505 [Sulfolobaceae archaeon]